MEEKATPTLKHPEVVFLSLFGIGFISKGSGTIGSLTMIPLLYLLGEFSPPVWIFIPFLTVFVLLSCYTAGLAQNKFGTHDPSWIVADEAVGMFVAWLFVLSNEWASLAIIFVLFRFFDVVKIWPASYFDKRVISGVGIVLDDVVSAIYAGLTFMLLHRLLLST